MPDGDEATYVLAIGVVLLARPCRELLSPPDRPALFIGFVRPDEFERDDDDDKNDGDDDDGEAEALPAISFYAVARSVADVRELAGDHVARRFGSDRVEATCFLELNEASSADLRGRLKPGEARPGVVRDFGRPLLILDATEKKVKEVLDYVADEFLTPHEAEEGIWFLAVRATPAPQNPEFQTLGGAYINAWVKAPFREDALVELEKDLGQVHWRPRVVTCSYPAILKDTQRKARRHYKQAKSQGACYNIFAFPPDAGGPE